MTTYTFAPHSEDDDFDEHELIGGEGYCYTRNFYNETAGEYFISRDYLDGTERVLINLVRPNICLPIDFLTLSPDILSEEWGINGICDLIIESLYEVDEYKLKEYEAHYKRSRHLLTTYKKVMEPYNNSLKKMIREKMRIKCTEKEIDEDYNYCKYWIQYLID